MNVAIPWWIPTAVGVAALTVGYLAHAILTRMRITGADKTAREILRDARLEAEVIRKQAKLEARDEVLRARNEFEEQVKTRREEIREAEERIAKREANLDRKVALLDKKEEKIELAQAQIDTARRELAEKHARLEELLAEEKESIQRVAGMSREEARKLLLQDLEKEVRNEAGVLLRRIQQETKETAERQAREIIINAIERYAADQVNEITTCTVNLPGDDMKGRIIGREGRNIRAFEEATGVDILIDDTPEVVVISSFDPIRREVARVALERLVTDGRIHPASIEDAVNKAREELDERIRQAGEEAIYELGIESVDPELVHTLGRLKFRHSYAQNVLRHSVEMAHIMGMMAAELGLDPSIARRVGLFHDIGKALDHQIEGSHAIIGADLLRKHGENPVVYNAVAAHHGEVEGESPYAALASAADAITAARPGARVENTEIYLKRLEKLEEIANSFRGVEKSYAIRAGRELRVLVEPAKIDDNEAMQMARNISKQIEDKLEYPGQIKVTVIRQTRCIEYAR